jgi:hypothetical protein
LVSLFRQFILDVVYAIAMNPLFCHPGFLPVGDYNPEGESRGPGFVPVKTGNQFHSPGFRVKPGMTNRRLLSAKNLCPFLMGMTTNRSFSVRVIVVRHSTILVQEVGQCCVKFLGLFNRCGMMSVRDYNQLSLGYQLDVGFFYCYL